MVCVKKKKKESPDFSLFLPSDSACWCLSVRIPLSWQGDRARQSDKNSAAARQADLERGSLTAIYLQARLGVRADPAFPGKTQSRT